VNREIPKREKPRKNSQYRRYRKISLQERLRGSVPLKSLTIANINGKKGLGNSTNVETRLFLLIGGSRLSARAFDHWMIVDAVRGIPRTRRFKTKLALAFCYLADLPRTCRDKRPIMN